jgi:hypothetical protein
MCERIVVAAADRAMAEDWIRARDASAGADARDDVVAEALVRQWHRADNRSRCKGIIRCRQPLGPYVPEELVSLARAGE